LKNNIHAFIVFTVGAGFKPAPTQYGKTLLLLKYFKKLNCYIILKKRYRWVRFT